MKANFKYLKKRVESCRRILNRYKDSKGDRRILQHAMAEFKQAKSELDAALRLELEAK